MVNELEHTLTLSKVYPLIIQHVVLNQLVDTLHEGSISTLKTKHYFLTRKVHVVEMNLRGPITRWKLTSTGSQFLTAVLTMYGTGKQEE